MFRPPLLACLLLAGIARTSDCRFVSGPDGVCAAFRLEPSRAELRSGDSLRIRVNGGLDCSADFDCVDCGNRRFRFRWQSTAPDVVSVDSTGVIRAEQPGIAQVRFESDGAAPEAASATVVVSH